MCTLTWWREAADTYEVFFNRDEKKTRSAAHPPRMLRRNDVSFLAPIDPDGGGTWILANARGVVVCLLNRWHEEDTARQPSRSRGELVMEMASLENVPAVEERLRGENLVGVRPFTMVGFDAVGERAWSWNGRELKVGKPHLPLCSSSYHFEEVKMARRERFEVLQASLRPGGELLESFHGDLGSEGAASAFTPRMCRPDAQTMSRSRVRVSGNRVTWTYLEEQRDLAGAPRRYEAAL